MPRGAEIRGDCQESAESCATTRIFDTESSRCSTYYIAGTIPLTSNS